MKQVVAIISTRVIIEVPEDTDREVCNDLAYEVAAAMESRFSYEVEDAHVAKHEISGVEVSVDGKDITSLY